MDNQDYRLLKRFITRESIPVAELIASENISQKTLQKRLAKLNENIHGIGQIKERHGRYFLQVIDYHGLSRLQSGYLRESLDFNDSEKRQAYIIQQLVTTTGYVVQDDLADTLMISRSTLSKDLDKLRRTLRVYDAEIVAQSNHGIKLVLDQAYQLPLLLLNEVYDYFAANYPLTPAVQQALAAVSNQINDQTTATRLQKLTAIMSFLWRDDRQIDLHVAHYQNLVRLTPEWQQLFRALSAQRQTNLTATEQDFICFPVNLKYSSLLSRSLVAQQLDKNQALLQQIKRQIEVHVQVELDYAEFYTQVKYHLLFLCYRSLFNMPASEIFTNEIIKNYPVAAELALIALNTLEQGLGAIIPTTEATYLTVYFQLALDAVQDQQHVAQQVGIVGNIGLGAQHFLKKQLAEVFADQIKVVAITDKAQLKQPDLPFLLIFSDQPLDLGDNRIPVIRIDDLFRTEELTTKITLSLVHKAIMAQACHLQITYLTPQADYQATVDQMIEQATLKGELAPSFKQMWHQRELQGSSVFENGIALPHTINEIAKPVIFLQIGILQKPLLVNKRKVHLIFLLGIPQQLNQQLNRVLDTLYDFIFSVVRQENVLQNLLHYRLDQPIEQLTEGI
ncbi:BglG family transcription antiterminator [Loigolactobacillus coryniformis subsp. coryniformis]|jgi:lichenan operon transcriptional antiterminator|uniref:BglG family transcription antiterminator n=1 Tax=Loigolactobacillus coryniformis TaxID=1610 RepID=UPI00288EEEF6|nr:PRD domain-containing protein [Bacillota bacterium]